MREVPLSQIALAVNPRLRYDSDEEYEEACYRNFRDKWGCDEEEARKAARWCVQLANDMMESGLPSVASIEAVLPDA